MNPLFQAAREIPAFLRKRRWSFCIIGGLAVARWGEERAMKDVDITLWTGVGDEREFIDVIYSAFEARIPDAKEFAITNRVLLCQATNGTGIDIALGGLPYEARLLQRATPHVYVPRIKWITASAEDTIVLKAIAERDHDAISSSARVMIDARQAKKRRSNSRFPALLIKFSFRKESEEKCPSHYPA